MEEVQKIAIVGPESTGKSTLSRQLAGHFEEPWVPEYARTYLEHLGRAYRQSDLRAIARGQLAWERARLKQARALLVCDTNLLVIRIWSEVKYGEVDAWIRAQEHLDSYALHLLTDIDLPWEDDPLREHPEPAQRAELLKRYEQALRQAGVPFVVVSGKEEERLQRAAKALEMIGPSSGS